MQYQFVYVKSYFTCLFSSRGKEIVGSAQKKKMFSFCKGQKKSLKIFRPLLRVSYYYYYRDRIS